VTAAPISVPARWIRRHALPLAVTGTLLLPLVIATVVLGGLEWAPIFDMALIEQRVRDVGTARTPLVGMPGRLGPQSEPASHPGPIGFYLLAPAYRLLGGSAWALEASAALLNALALAATVFVAWRRRSAAVVGVTGVGLALLMQGYGPSLLTEPWNPNLAVLWFAAFLVAVWSVVQGDVAMLPVVTTTASICAQSHVSYVAVCAGIGAVAALRAAATILRSKRGSDERKHSVRSAALALACLVVAWLPPLVENLMGSPGNLTRLVEYFSDPAVEPIGVRQALPFVFFRFNLQYLVVDQTLAPAGFSQPMTNPASTPLSALTLSLWVLCALGSLALRNRMLLALHGVVLAGLGVMLLATSRVIGYPLGHVMFWSWGIAMLLVVACAATIGCAIARICPESLRQKAARWAPALALAAVLVSTSRVAWAALSVRPSVYQVTQQLKALSRDTIAALQRNTGGATGLSGRYLVSWSDFMHSGGLGIGLVNELERAGFDAAYDHRFTPMVGLLRARDPGWATARIHFANGAWITEARRMPASVQAAYVDLRTDAEKSEAAELSAAIVHALREAGERDLEWFAYDMERSMAAHPGLHFFVILAGGRLMEIGSPGAIFIMPPGAIVTRTSKPPGP
jgi:hypothetical protein